MGRVDARVAHFVSAAGLQLRRDSDRPEPPPAVGPEASGRSGLEVRMSRATADLRGRVGMYCLIAAEAAIFTIFVVAYVFYLGKSVAGPKPADVLHAPVFLTVCLLSSSVTVHAGVKALEKGHVAGFARWWMLTLTL